MLRRSKYCPCVQNRSPFPLPAVLNRENLQKLELGLLDEISFSPDQKQFSLEFDSQQEKFFFTYSDVVNAPHSNPLDDLRKPCTWSSPILDVVEKKLDGTIVHHPLQRSIHYSYQSGPWYNPFEKFQIGFSGGNLGMNMNSEYIFPLSQGNFSIQLFRTRL
jgi:hypothetical protein